MILRFRDRIALFSSLAASVTIGIVFLVVYGVVYFTAYRHLDNDLIQEQEEVIKKMHWKGDSIILTEMLAWEANEHNEVEANPSFLQVIDVNGHLIFRTANLQQVKLLINPNLKKTAFFNSTINGQRSRQGQFPILNDDQKVIGFMTVGISQEESANVLHNLRTTLLIAFPLVLIVLFLVTSFAAEKGILPVHRLIQAANAISDANIDQRLPLPGNRDEIHRLASTINDLLQRLESSVQREKQFIADASHELRTPLSGIRGTLEVLIRRRREQDYYEEKVGLVIREVDRMHQMLDQLLQLARLESGSVAVKNVPVPLKAYLQTIAEKFQSKFKESGIGLNLDIPPQVIVNTDASLFDPIVSNLLANALKYGQEGGEITCSWNAAEQSLRILDNGQGIEPEHLPHLFDRFYRSDGSRNSGIPGAGLGLSIVKKLTDILHIRITVQSHVGKGSTFTLFFP